MEKILESIVANVVTDPEPPVLVETEVEEPVPKVEDSEPEPEVEEPEPKLEESLIETLVDLPAESTMELLSL